MKLRITTLMLSVSFLGVITGIHGCGSPNSTTNVEKDFKLQQINPPTQVKSKFADTLVGLKPQDGDSGLLIGFDTDTTQNRKGYAQFYDFEKPDFQKMATNKTLYLARIGGQVKLAAKLDYIASPQKQGFVYAGQIRYLEKPRIEYCGCMKCTYSKCLIGFDYSRVWLTDSRQVIRSVQKQAINQIKGTVDSEFERLGVRSQDVTDYEKISFISDGFYVTEGFHSQITGGAAWFEAQTKNFVVPLSPDKKVTSNLRDLYTPKQVEAAFGDRTVRRWYGKNVNVVEASTFTLARVEGKTHVIGLIEVDGNAHRIFHKPFDLGLAPNKLVVYDNPSLDFSKFKSIYPTIIDVFISPNQNTIFVLTKEEIIGIDVREEKEVFRAKHNLLFNKVIMVEWATGDFARQWEKELATK